MKKWKSQWFNQIHCEGMPPEVLRRLGVLRRQLLLHAYIYYVLDDNIISDHEWDRRGKEHLALQNEHGWNINFYDEIFRTYNGQSAYWFPTNQLGIDENIDRVANRILNHQRKIREYPDAIKTECGYVSATWEKGMTTLKSGTLTECAESLRTIIHHESDRYYTAKKST